MTIYERIKYLRESLNMSQQELAEKVGYKDKSAISKVERGDRDINQKMIMKYAQVLGVSPTYILYGQEPEAKKENPPEDPKITEGKRKLLEFANSVPEEKIDLVLRVMQSIVEAD